MSIFNEVTKTVKSIFNADDDMMFEDDVEFSNDNQQNSGFSFPKPFKKQTKEVQNPNNKLNFDFQSHGFEMAKTDKSQKPRSNGKIQVYVPKSFEESFGIIKDVKSGFTAMVNVEVANTQVAQRIIDVISGAIFALDGECKKMGEKQYIFSLSTETIGAYDFLPTSGMQNIPSQGAGFNFNMGQPFDFGAQQQTQAFTPNVQFNPNTQFNPNAQYNSNNQFNPNAQYNKEPNMNQNFNQQNYYYGQNAEKISQELQNFYQPPKSQF